MEEEKFYYAKTAVKDSNDNLIKAFITNVDNEVMLMYEEVERLVRQEVSKGYKHLYIIYDRYNSKNNNNTVFDAQGNIRNISILTLLEVLGYNVNYNHVDECISYLRISW